MEASTQILVRGKACDSLDSFQVAHERTMLEAIRLKPKLQWRLQDVGDDRNKGHALRQAAGNKTTQ
jgi:hypothetical protein